MKFLIEVAVWTAVTPLAFVLRLDGDVAQFATAALALTAVGIPLKAGAILWLGLHRRAWRRSGVADLLALVYAVTAVTAAVFIVALALGAFVDVPRSVPLIEGPLALLALGGGRLLLRLLHEQAGQRRVRSRGAACRVLVVGAGDYGAMAVREMRRHPEAGRLPVGFIDDDPEKRGIRHNGIDILGPIEELPAVARQHRIDEVLIAMPSEPGPVVRRVVELARQAGCEVRTLPALHDLMSGRVTVSAFREVHVEDLLRREPVRLDVEPIERYLRGRVVLVTGAGGSIGSELVRRAAGFGPAELVLLGRGENSVFEIDRELARTHPEVHRTPVICDVRDAGSLRRVFERFRPDVVLHAAAHKHVPLMEACPEQAVLNNVGGTRNLAELALEYGVRRLVNISTDKAVNPTSVMGAAKRVAEAVVADAALRCGPDCTFVSVRFGNVLGSRGSVVPVLKEQIRRGSGVTVTHPDMVRYFMTIPEAAQLVLQAGAIAENGRVYVLDMGEPVRIVDLARDLITLSGLEPERDVPIRFTGVRPGEKLFEELLTAEEGTEASCHEKIYVARQTRPSEGLEAQLDGLFAAAEADDDAGIRAALQAIVPTYKPAVPLRAQAGDGQNGQPPEPRPLPTPNRIRGPVVEVADAL